MPAPTRLPPRPWLLALLAAVLIFAGRSALVFYAGSPVPFHDQWLAEGEHILRYDARHELSWQNFFILNGDHLHVPTRFITLAIYRLTGRWDTLAEMVINNAIIAAAFGYLIYSLLRNSTRKLTGLAVLVTSLWLASPLFYGNALWGFQSSIELLVLTAVVQIVATATMQRIGLQWWLATAAAVLGFVSFGSALMTPLTCLMICALRFRDSQLSRSALYGAIAVNLAMLGCGIALVMRSPSFGNGGPVLANIVHTSLHALSWPAMGPSWVGVVLWAPTIAATAWIIRARPIGIMGIYALAIWTALQIGGIALTRSLPVPAMAPRYYDIFAVGVIANGALVLALLHNSSARSRVRFAMFAFVGLWFASVGWKASLFARSHTIHDVPAMRSIATGQIELLNRYYSGEGIAALNAVQFPFRPHPDIDYLNRQLADPVIRQALPNFLSDGGKLIGTTLIDYPWPSSSSPIRLRWFQFFTGLGCAAVLAFLFVVYRTHRPHVYSVGQTSEGP